MEETKYLCMSPSRGGILHRANTAPFRAMMAASSEREGERERGEREGEGGGSEGGGGGEERKMDERGIEERRYRGESV